MLNSLKVGVRLVRTEDSLMLVRVEVRIVLNNFVRTTVGTWVSRFLLVKTTRTVEPRSFRLVLERLLGTTITLLVTSL